MDTTLPPVDGKIHPENELPAPHDFQLPAPHDMQLRPPHLTEKYPWLHWTPALLGLFIGIFVGGTFFAGANTTQEETKQQTQEEVLYMPPLPTTQIATPTALPSPTIVLPSEGLGYSNQPQSYVLDNHVYACPDDVLQCPDGSVVRRGGPNCEFLACTTMQP